MNITFKQLEAFYNSATLRSFSAAALRLHTTQSAISKRVAELESEFAAPVLRRTPRGLELTQTGRRLLPLAEQSRQLWQRIEAEMAAGGAVRGTYRVGVTELVAITWLTALMHKIQAEHPGLTLEPVVDRGLALLDDLKDSKLDLVIMPGVYWGPQYVTVQVGKADECWVASPALKLPRRALKPHEFAQLPVLEMAARGSKHTLYEPWRAQHGFKFDKVLSTNSTTALRELAIGGFGVGLMALDFVGPDIDAALLRVVKSDPMPPPLVYSAVYRRDNACLALEHIVSLALQCCDFRRRAQTAGKPGKSAPRAAAQRARTR